MRYKRIAFNIIILFFLTLILKTPISYSTDEIISSQMETLNISSFIKEGEKYTEDIFPDLNGNELLSSAIKGNIDNNIIFKSILSLLRERSCNRNNFDW